ncbi:MAG: hypothetical protein PHS37_09150, partial [Candidatus Omnitrophica bacterium]|nr:hypothetical protein [Candidatus Omnitrophota bacterium]
MKIYTHNNLPIVTGGLSRYFIKLTSLITLCGFIGTQVMSTAGMEDAWAQAKSPYIAKEIFIPPKLGTVTGAWQTGTTNIIHIQDAHCNYEAQRAISRLIGYAHRRYGAKVVNVEGGKGAFRLGAFTGIKDVSVRQKVADYFLRQGLINGAEYFAVTNPKAVTLWGIEDASLYKENLTVYRDFLNEHEAVTRSLTGLKAVLDGLKEKIYRPGLYELDRQAGAYRTGALDLKVYVAYLIDLAQKTRIRAAGFTNVAALARCLDTESLIDFKKATLERDELVSRLQEVLSEYELKELVGWTVNFTNGTVRETAFYQYLLMKAASVGLDLKRSNELQKYLVYLAGYEAVDKTVLFTEVERLEEALFKALASSGRSRILVRLSKNLGIMENLFETRITPEDHAYYEKHKGAFRADVFVKFIRDSRGKACLAPTVETCIQQLDNYRAMIERFYKCSMMRDEAFERNMKYGTVGAGLEPAPTVTILVTGGFHTPNLTRLLKTDNIGYVSVMPVFAGAAGAGDPNGDSLYRSLIGGKGHPLLDMPVESAYTHLAVAPFTSDPAFTGMTHSDTEMARFEITYRWRVAVESGAAGYAVVDKKTGRIMYAFDTKGPLTDPKPADVEGYAIDDWAEIAGRYRNREGFFIEGRTGSFLLVSERSLPRDDLWILREYIDRLDPGTKEIVEGVVGRNASPGGLKTVVDDCAVIMRNVTFDIFRQLADHDPHGFLKALTGDRSLALQWKKEAYRIHCEKTGIALPHNFDEIRVPYHAVTLYKFKWDDFCAVMDQAVRDGSFERIHTSEEACRRVVTGYMKRHASRDTTLQMRGILTLGAIGAGYAIGAAVGPWWGAAIVVGGIALDFFGTNILKLTKKIMRRNTLESLYERVISGSKKARKKARMNIIRHILDSYKKSRDDAHDQGLVKLIGLVEYEYVKCSPGEWAELIPHLKRFILDPAVADNRKTLAVKLLCNSHTLKEKEMVPHFVELARSSDLGEGSAARRALFSAIKETTRFPWVVEGLVTLIKDTSAPAYARLAAFDAVLKDQFRLVFVDAMRTLIPRLKEAVLGRDPEYEIFNAVAIKGMWGSAYRGNRDACNALKEIIESELPVATPDVKKTALDTLRDAAAGGNKATVRTLAQLAPWLAKTLLADGTPSGLQESAIYSLLCAGARASDTFRGILKDA